MASLQRVAVGEYIGAAMWTQGDGVEGRYRNGEGIGIRVEENWVHLYLRDGEEVVKLSRKTNHSAQVFPGMTLREAVRQLLLNKLSNSTRCCYGRYGGYGIEMERDTHLAKPCPTHSQQWIEDETTRCLQKEMANVISDEDWPAELARRRAEADAQAGVRQQARDSGEGEWRKHGKQWLVSIRDHAPGDVVVVRRKNGSTAQCRLGQQVKEGLYEAEKLPE